MAEQKVEPKVKNEGVTAEPVGDDAKPVSPKSRSRGANAPKVTNKPKPAMVISNTRDFVVAFSGVRLLAKGDKDGRDKHVVVTKARAQSYMGNPLVKNLLRLGWLTTESSEK